MQNDNSTITSNETIKENKSALFLEGYQPFKRGYQPKVSNLNPSNPPQGGSGVPPKSNGDKTESKK
jgi:hypothetical protein